MGIQLSDHFSFGKIFRFTLPSIGMMVFTSLYSLVDGFFISNFAGETAFAGVNLIAPFLMMFSAVGFMIGSGGCALVGRTLGEKDRGRANSIFSLLVYTVIVLGSLCTLIAQLFMDRIATGFGAQGQLKSMCMYYGRIFCIGFPFFMLQAIFQSFMITAERPKFALAVTVIAGLTNMILDWLFVGVFRWGVKGAAVATVISQVMGGGIPLVYFILPNRSLLRLGRSRLDFHVLGKVFANGSSELMSNISMSVVNMAYNFQLMRFIGEKGVSTFGVIMYVGFLFAAIFLGYSMGVAPVFSYNLGAQNNREMKSLLGKSLVIIGAFSFLTGGMAEISAPALSSLYVGYDQELFEMTKMAFRLYSLAFFLAGFNIFASSFFTALNNGLVSAIISFSRVLLFQLIAVFALPAILGINGIWLSMAASEFCALVVSLVFMLVLRRRYGY